MERERTAVFIVESWAKLENNIRKSGGRDMTAAVICRHFLYEKVICKDGYFCIGLQLFVGCKSKFNFANCFLGENRANSVARCVLISRAAAKAKFAFRGRKAPANLADNDND